MDNLPVGTKLEWWSRSLAYVVTERWKDGDIEYITLFGSFPGDASAREETFTVSAVQDLISSGTLVIKRK